MTNLAAMQFAAGCRVDAGTPPVLVGQQYGIASVSRTGIGVYRVQTSTPYGVGECIPLLTIAEAVGDTTISSSVQAIVGAVTTFDVTIRTAGVPADIDFWFALVSLIG